MADEAELVRLATLRPESEWHEDHGPVLWHHLNEWGQVCEAPFVGDPMSEDWDGYYTHWSPLPRVQNLPDASDPTP